MEGALFIGEDLRVLTSSLAAAQADADAAAANLRELAKLICWCLKHSCFRRECGCREEEK